MLDSPASASARHSSRTRASVSVSRRSSMLLGRRSVLSLGPLMIPA
ncbi:hypothetical protein [Litorihabitans aurantiacus]|nr:hypothetical protein [Litorihabitans aurantiacus]